MIIFSIVGLLILKPLIGRPRPFMVEAFDLLIKEPMGYSSHQATQAHLLLQPLQFIITIK
ncbi:hypothetical protein [Peptoniphilus harei]|uniref:hypothetical protein n=1 Tax=Peptoniphilus harei TaxID=54005 RepID=UPI001F33DFF5|nr:hypothetical protein [Peptoniphilus harei]